jgi:hypothetical protein
MALDVADPGRQSRGQFGVALWPISGLKAPAPVFSDFRWKQAVNHAPEQPTTLTPAVELADGNPPAELEDPAVRRRVAELDTEFRAPPTVPLGALHIRPNELR